MKHNLKTTRAALSLVLAFLLCLSFTACGVKASQSPAPSVSPTLTPAAEKVSTLDYSDKANWAYYAEGSGKDADVFLVCPSIDMGKSGNMNITLDDTMKGKFVAALNMERGIYDKSASLYAPYYRQVTAPVYEMPEGETKSYYDIAYSDVKAAFLRYIADTPEDRPFIFAGFSQGSDMILRLMKELFGDAKYQRRLIAAYCIGWRMTNEDIRQCPWLTPAKAADDTGVIIMFNSEAVDITDSLLVPAGTKTYSINPLNWKTDATPAAASENLGACFPGGDGKITKELPAMTGAYIDGTRGTLKLPDVSPADYPAQILPDGIFHIYDYQFFYRNLQANVKLRTERYLAANR